MSTELPAVSNTTTLSSPEFEAADLIIHYLEAIGVDHIFGVPGGAIEPIYNALARSARRGSVAAVGACHEAAAAYMADGYFRESGKLGVCVATSGPGATNLITGVACAYDNNIPMLVISGQPTITSFGKGALQESSCTGVNVMGMFRHCTKYDSLVSHINQLETKLVTAILQALQSPQGPVHLSIPVDILRAPVAKPLRAVQVKNQIEYQNRSFDESAVEALFDELMNDPEPLFFVGNGAAGAVDKIMELVDICGARFISAPDAKGLVNIRHASYRGVFGLGGHASAVQAIHEHASSIVAFGTGFGEFTSGGWDDALLSDRLIHVDQSTANLVQSPMAKLHVQGHIPTLCRKLLQKLAAAGRVADPNPRHYEKTNPNVTVQDASKYHSDEVPIKPQRLMKCLSESFPGHTRFVADAGNSMMWAPHYLQLIDPRQRLNPAAASPANSGNERRRKQSNWLQLTLNFAPMGWAIGAAVGMSRANPRAPVVCITGDGSYLMSGQEITVAAKEKLPVTFVILNDSVYGMVMHGQRLAGAEPIGFELPTIDFAKLAASMGIRSHVIRCAQDFEKIAGGFTALDQGPLLLDVRIDKEEVPPMINRLKVLGTAKETTEV